MQFTALTQTGSGRGADFGYPTMNLVLDDVPESLDDGVYACKTTIDGMEYDAIMHKGERPTFGDTPSCEIYILDECFVEMPTSIAVQVFGRVRPVQSFDSAEDLHTQIEKDIAAARAILSAT